MAESILLGTEAQGTRLLQSSVGSVGMGGCACVFISSSSFYCEDVTGQVVSYSRKDFSTVFLVNSSEPLTAYLLASSFQLPASFPHNNHSPAAGTLHAIPLVQQKQHPARKGFPSLSPSSQSLPPQDMGKESRVLRRGPWFWGNYCQSDTLWD